MLGPEKHIQLQGEGLSSERRRVEAAIDAVYAAATVDQVNKREQAAKEVMALAFDAHQYPELWDDITRAAQVMRARRAE